MALIQQQSFARAKDLCTSLCKKNPQDAQAWLILASIHSALGSLHDAEKCCVKVTRLQPGQATGFYNLGVIQQDLGDFEKAIASYRKAVQINAVFPLAWFFLGNCLYELGKYPEAISCYRKTIDLQPKNFEAFNNLGNSLKACGNYNEAVGTFKQALEINPEYAHAYSNLGCLLQDMKELEQALSHLQTAVRLDPQSGETLYNLANVQNDLRQHSTAETNFRKSLKLNPDLVEAYINLGSTLVLQGRIHEGANILHKAIQIDNTNPTANSSLLFCMNYSPDYSPTDIFSVHRDWGNRLVANPIVFHNKPDPGKRLRIGYVSPDFRFHSVASFLEPILGNHNHDNFEVYGYAELKHADKMTSKLKSLCSHWRETTRLTDADVIKLIRNDKIDILVDLAGHTDNNRLGVFAERAAPIQVTYLGYPNSTGLQTVDYRITDDITDPREYDEVYTENLIRLPGPFLCYKPPEFYPDIVEPPVKNNNFVTFGSFNNLAKINEAVVSLWASILNATPRSRLMLKSKPFVDPGIRTRYEAMFLHHGISSDRLELIDWTLDIESHLRLYNKIDIALDTFPYNGTTTTCEALWMGLPVVTLKGNRHAGRVGASLLHHIGLDNCIGDTRERYQDIALSLANDIDHLCNLRTSIRSMLSNSPVCDSAKFTGSLEHLYRQMWNSWCQQDNSDSNA